MSSLSSHLSNFKTTKPLDICLQRNTKENDGRPSSVHVHVHCLRSEQCTCMCNLNKTSHCWIAMHECQGPGSDNNKALSEELRQGKSM